MAEGTSSDIWEELVECPLCLERCQNPRGLPCQHVFCMTCIENLIRNCNQQRQITCPSCRKGVKIPRGGASGFPIAYIVNKLTDAMRKQTISRPRQVNKCTKHKEEFRLQCEECQQTVCTLCVPEHPGHIMVSLVELQGRQLQNMKENKEQLSKRVKEYEARIQTVNGSKTLHKQASEKQIRDLDEHGKKIINKVNRGIAEIKNIIRTETDKAIKEFENLEANMTSEMAQLYQHIDDIEGVLGNPEQQPAIDINIYKQALQQLQATHEVPEKSIVINLADIGQLSTKLLVGELHINDGAAARSGRLSRLQAVSSSQASHTL